MKVAGPLPRGETVKRHSEKAANANACERL